MAVSIVEGLGWLVVALFSLYVYQVLRDARRRLPPGPWPPKPIVGDILDLGEDGQQHKVMRSMAERYGPLMSLRLGTGPHVIVSSPSALRAVFGEGKVDNIAGLPHLDVLEAKGHSAHTVFALQSLDSRWRAIRKFASLEMLAPRRITAGGAASAQARLVEALYREVSDHAARGTPLVFKNAVLAVMLNLMHGVIYSTDVDSKGTAEFGDIVEEIVQMLGTSNVSDLVPAVAKLDLQGLRRRMAELLTVLYEHYDKQVAARLRSRAAGEPRKNDVLDTVLDMESDWKKDKSELSHHTMKVLLSDLYGAGSSPMAATIEWGMADLLQHPRVLRKLKEELTSVLGDKKLIEEDDVARLPYLQAVVKEIQRFRVALPLMPRRAEADIEVNGYCIPKGTPVLVNAYAINRSAEAWSEPDTFLPERFIGGDGDGKNVLGQYFELIPFGIGRRICPGMPLAQKLIPLILATLVHRFDYELPADVKEAGIDMREKSGVVLTLLNPLKAIPKEI